ncbi:glycerophosphodiester phosphodiesterase [Alkalihalobacillus sp. AL-G]|uniref:glycerophosphodiester phosphodiesterase n=1 Tax=Alkalihalobacillus sp. AL-G TaxID=2926399 RepID=UPI00272C1159|nr:glycerophosphodiester phosphodiesterase [Alkalihalobacillus sp. AL-G]WLD91947.1 glycerophosphodiester phosphodiesterase [Alkalihalobacillus sp. AL-G]
MTYIFAHRGASKYAPENTMASFQKAIELNADGIELDVQLSKDNIPVVIHDENVKRTTDGKGLVCEYSFEQLQCFDAGNWFSSHFQEERIPSLEEVLIWIKSTPLKLNLELKNTILPHYGMERLVYDLVTKYDLNDRIIYSSFNHYSLRELQRIDRTNEIAPLYSSGLYEPWNYVRKLNTKSAHPHWRTLNASILKSFTKHGIKVRTYTVNDPKKMRWLFDQQVEAIITDVPDIAKNVLDGVHHHKPSKILTILQKLNPL